MLSDQDWAAYRNLINSTQATRFQEEVTWLRTVTAVSRYGEDIPNEDQYNEIQITGLIQYNTFRSWPLNQNTNSGEIDKESMVLFLNLKYLDDLGYLDSNKNFNFNRGLDRFRIKGVLYKPSADTDAAQAFNDPLLTMVVLKREEIESGDNLIE